MELSYNVGGRTFGGYLADGSGGKPAPAVLVIHEGNGLREITRRRADMLASLGYVAYAPDMFGELIDSLDRVFEVVHGLTADWRELRARQTAALDVLRAQPNVDASRIAAIGFCFGGQAVLELARSGADLRAVVGFHMILKGPTPQDTPNIKAKVLVCNGDLDPFAPPEDRVEFLKIMTEAGVDCQLLLFAGVGHSFMNPDADAQNMEGVRYDATADRRAWAAMQTLFAETLS
jgi:dienelactone hydrolase